jgi:Protein of unknown function (DUF742)
MDISQRPAEDLWFDEEAGPVVRPYAMTAGRTRPTRGDFDLISLVVANQPAVPPELGMGPEHAAIIRLCQRPQSVAEIAAILDLPIGIVRVFLGDLLDKELIMARAPAARNQAPNEGILKAVINGLRTL